MPAIVSAHLRKCRSLLESALSDHPDGVVYLASARLGTLRELSPRWRVYGERIRIELVAGERQAAYWLSTARILPAGLELLLSTGCRRLPLSLSVVWGTDEPPRSYASGRFWDVVRGWLSLRYPGARIRSVRRRSDRTHSISGTLLRVLFSHDGRDFALLACDPDTASQDGHAVLTQALLWAGLLARRRRSRGVPGLIILIPQSLSAVVGHCQRLLRPRIALWQIEQDPRGDRINRADCPAPPVENRDFRWPVLGPFRWSARLGRVLDLAPELIRRYPRFDDYDSLRLYGLEFARASGEDRGRILFGIGTQQTELTDENFDELRTLVDEILYYRRPDSPCTGHPYYRMQAERWLESLILEAAPRLFPELAPEAVYSQIPVYLGKDPGRVDVLAVDREGTLVVMELKVAPNPNLPLQALDYWGRVTQHNNHGDFERRGYFAEVRLTRRLPRIYLVAPVFSFHDSTETILGYLDPSLEVWKVALNEDWRSGVRVMGRTLVKCGHERDR